MVEKIARAICKSRTCRGGGCCEWPSNMGLRNECPVPKGNYDDAARAAVEATAPEIMKVFEPYLSAEYSIPESITARQIHDDMRAKLRAILDEK